MPQCPGIGYNIRIPTRNFCEFCKISITYPELLGNNSFKFCKTSIPVPGTSVSYVRLRHNTRGAGMPLLFFLQHPGYRHVFGFYPRGGCYAMHSDVMPRLPHTQHKFLSFLSETAVLVGSCTTDWYSPAFIRQSWWWESTCDVHVHV